MLYIPIAVYLIISLPLALLLWAALVAAKWGDSDNEKETSRAAMLRRAYSANGD